ncbi:tyrosine-protein phosphatase [Lacticaseibacillus paracasei]|uniref:tyrosine-protein phosphatase n=1 Tax=Lacticaseibacillus paracasei TaxID=1597 RepID=UPI0014023158|nr:tyrosine-protein phosphatase [Lacticaseibacillus paracasei]
MTLKKITNFRSLGGYQNAHGQMVKEGLIFRSGQLFELEDDQSHYLGQTLGIKHIVDMRSDDERTEFPDTVWEGADYAVLDILKDATANNASLGRMITEKGNVHENMLATYEQLALSDSAKTGYRQFIQGLLRPNEPTIFHCFAGKDRTGVGAALILKILDVSEQGIMADYLQTNAERTVANEEILAGLKERGFTDQQLKSIGEALKVDADYLRRYFQVIDQQFGSFQQYLREGLKLSAGEIAQFRDLYLQK